MPKVLTESGEKELLEEYNVLNEANNGYPVMGVTLGALAITGTMLFSFLQETRAKIPTCLHLET
jgi:hypothetical protein